MMAQTTAANASGSKRSARMEDRLSSLSDDLLHNIMSFLTSRQAVQTCVLSRRWVGLWCSVPCLNVDQREFQATPPKSWYSLDRTPEDVRFMNFVEGLLRLHRAVSLDKFSVHVTNWYARAIGLRCLPRAIECCPEVLELCYSYYNDSYKLIPLGSSSCRLRRLHLAGCFLDKDFVLHLSSGCPALEDLELEECFIAHPKIMSSTLKNLAIIDCTTYWWGHPLTVTAQALVSFRLAFIPTGSVWNGIVLDEMPYLIKASICLRSHPIPHEGPFKLLCSLTNARKLELSGSDTLRNLHEEDTFPKFPNLRTLLLNECDMGNNMILEKFLNNATSLEKLTLQYCKLAEVLGNRKRTVNKMMSPELCQDAPAFECPSLRFTEIRYREGDFNKLFGHLSGIWRNLQKSTITLTKA